MGVNSNWPHHHTKGGEAAATHRCARSRTPANAMARFLQSSAAGVYFQVDEQIQVLGPHVHQDILAKLNIGCELFGEELGAQVNWIKDAQCEILQGAHQLANDVDTRLIRNDQRNAAKEGATYGLFTTMRNLAEEMEKNCQGDRRPIKLHIPIYRPLTPAIDVRKLACVVPIVRFRPVALE